MNDSLAPEGPEGALSRFFDGTPELGQAFLGDRELAGLAQNHENPCERKGYFELVPSAPQDVGTSGRMSNGYQNGAAEPCGSECTGLRHGTGSARAIDGKSRVRTVGESPGDGQEP
jgi:hypothetical protein